MLPEAVLAAFQSLSASRLILSVSVLLLAFFLISDMLMLDYENRAKKAEKSRYEELVFTFRAFLSYLIECKHCNMKYVGETKRILKFRFAEHRGYVNNNDDTATGEHFNMPGHSLSDMTVTVLEKVKTNDDMYRKEHESYFIRKFNTYYRGLNRQP